MLEKSDCPGAVVAAANRNGSRSADFDAAPGLYLALRWLEGRMGVAWRWLGGGFGVAVGWLCTPESMPSICLLYGFVVALGGLRWLCAVSRPYFCPLSG
jgi:hypothetical protein